MAAWGYKFHLRVVKVCLTHERYFQREDKIRILKRPCNVLKFPHKTQLFLFIFETAKIVNYCSILTHER